MNTNSQVTALTWKIWGQTVFSLQPGEQWYTERRPYRTQSAALLHIVLLLRLKDILMYIIVPISGWKSFLYSNHFLIHSDFQWPFSWWISYHSIIMKIIEDERKRGSNSGRVAGFLILSKVSSWQEEMMRGDETIASRFISMRGDSLSSLRDITRDWSKRPWLASCLEEHERSVSTGPSWKKTSPIWECRKKQHKAQGNFFRLFQFDVFHSHY